MKKTIIIGSICLILGGCTSNPLATEAEARKRNIGLLCSRVVDVDPKFDYHIFAKKELKRRGISVKDCMQMG